MIYTQSVASYGTNRLSKVLSETKHGNPEDVKEALKSDLKKLLSNFVELNGNVKIDIRDNGEGFDILMKASAERIKPIGFLRG